MPSPDTNSASGPPAALIARIDHLGTLLKGLPATLPVDPPDTETKYFFGLDQDEVAEEGVFAALTRNLERCFQTHVQPPGGTLKFTERGKRCVNLVKVLKTAMRNLSPAEREVIVETWVERLITAARNSGAKIARKRR